MLMCIYTYLYTIYTHIFMASKFIPAYLDIWKIHMFAYMWHIILKYNRKTDIWLGIEKTEFTLH